MSLCQPLFSSFQREFSHSLIYWKVRTDLKHEHEGEFETSWIFSESLRVKWVGRPKKTTMEVKGEGKSGSKVNEMGSVPLSNRGPDPCLITEVWLSEMIRNQQMICHCL